MSTTTSYRLSGIALVIGSVLAAVYYISQAFIGGPFPEALAGPIAVIGSLAGFIGSLLMLLGLPAIYARQARQAGLLGLLGFVLVWYVILFQGILIPFTSVTIVPQLVTNPATRQLLADGPLASFNPFFIPSAVGQTLGVLLLGIATLRAHVFPRWTAWLLLVGLVLGVLSFIPFLSEPLGGPAEVVANLAIAGFGYALLGLRNHEAMSAVPASTQAEARA